ncbi:24115_t:CDS:2 [Cetraspora pellucida]|uniref:24115_t:CDS:1 n=1 Tax=Cetraspora pellucida TaxID=1433469 RepID=A0A9N9JMP7_9GLOM|nr:24115_t:CDS:2 [Cetraspora pellucida]
MSGNKSSSTRNARPMREIPKELDLNNIYNPKYHITELISTKKRSLESTHVPRPPNGFFLMKNCYMLELRKLGYRFTMPEICRHSKKIWATLPQHAKKTYESLSLQSQCVHNERYPNYKFSPKKRNNNFKQYLPKPKIEDLAFTSAFSTTNFLGTSDFASDKDSYLENSLLSSESEVSSFSSSPTNSLDLSAFLSPPLEELPSLEQFSSGLSSEFSTSLPSSLSTSLSTPLSTSLSTSFESQPGLIELGLFDFFSESPEGAQDFHWPILWDSDLDFLNTQNNQNYFSTDNSCYVYDNCFSFMTNEENGLQIQFFSQ